MGFTFLFFSSYLAFKIGKHLALKTNATIWQVCFLAIAIKFLVVSLLVVQ